MEDRNINFDNTLANNKRVDGIIFPEKRRVTPSVQEKVHYFTEKTAAPDKIKKKKSGSIYGFFIALFFIFLFSILPIRILEGQKNMTARAKEGISDLSLVYDSVQKHNYDGASVDLSNIQKNIEEINNELEDMGQKNIFFSRFSTRSFILFHFSSTFASIFFQKLKKRDICGHKTKFSHFLC